MAGVETKTLDRLLFQVDPDGLEIGIAEKGGNVTGDNRR